jgi:uncharacterized Zn finger protein
MAKKESVKCPKCSGEKFSVATDKSNKHYCQTKGCGNIFVPGLDAMKRPDVMIRHLQQENQKLLAELTSLRNENQKLKEQLVKLQPPTEPNAAPPVEEVSQDEIFT